MVIFLNLTIAILLTLVTYQDFKFRAVSWAIFPLLIAAMTIENVLKPGPKITTIGIGINVTFVLTQLILLTLYLSAKQRAFVRVWDAHIGPGDILFFIVLACFFTPFNFICFYVLSLLLTVAIVVMLKRYFPSFQQVPLAGIQSGLLLLLLIGNVAFGFADFKSDYLILTLL